MIIESEFSFLIDKKRVYEIQKKLKTIFEKNSKNEYGKIIAGHRAYSFELEVNFLKDYGIWWGMWNDKKAKRFVNAFGVGKPNWEKSDSMNCQISLPYSKVNRSTGGSLLINSKNDIYLAHSGKMGGSRKGISIDGFHKLFPKKKMWTIVSDGKKSKEYVLISKINDKNFLANLTYFIMEYHRIKEHLTQNASSSNQKSKLNDKITKMRLKLKSKKQQSQQQLHEKNNENEEDRFTNILKKLSKTDLNKMIRNYEEIHVKNKKSVTSNTYSRDPYLSALMKKLHNYTCQLCNQKTFQGKNGNFYTESHHVIPRSKNGADIPYNILIVCPTCHKIFDKANTNVLIDAYRKMRKNHLFTDFDALLKAKEITKSMYTKILR